MSRPPGGSQKIIQDKPDTLAARCTNGSGTAVPESVCDQTVAAYGTPRLGADEAKTDDVLKCQLKPLDRSGYPVTFTGAQWQELQRAFPNGVCDYSKPGADQGPTTGWFTYQDAVGHVIYGGLPLGPAPVSIPFGPGIPSGPIVSCARPSGRPAGLSLGPVSLGMTRSHARSLFLRSSTRGRLYMDFFCTTANGIRTGYASPALLRSLSRAQRRRVQRTGHPGAHGEPLLRAARRAPGHEAGRGCPAAASRPGVPGRAQPVVPHPQWPQPGSPQGPTRHHRRDRRRGPAAHRQSPSRQAIPRQVLLALPAPPAIAVAHLALADGVVAGAHPAVGLGARRIAVGRVAGVERRLWHGRAECVLVHGLALAGLAVVLDEHLDSAALEHGRRCRAGRGGEAILDRRLVARHEQAGDRPSDRKLAHREARRASGLDEAA